MDQPCLVISDIDGTLVGDSRSLAEFSEWVSERRKHLKLVYNSGRLHDSILEAIDIFNMPQPDAMIGGVGTQVREMVETEHDWLNDLTDWDGEIVRSLLANEPRLSLQPHEFLTPHKVSYIGENLSDEYLQSLIDKLASAGCYVDLVYSSNIDLDVLPRGVNKGTAAAWLANRWGFTPEQVFVCGDTGNDRAMFEQGFKGVVVGNAQSELKTLRGPNIFHATQHYAAGVLEGLNFWLYGERLTAW